ncbi:MAG: Stk1 family PASTA domain-containing Ser/Thr kinase [Actinomycetaceae bacterium]|nr:Stk1 family PASTA domain-containing Ser/Thr kinase [Actinomycetaceae bacterium]MDU0969394.1 Stk1 family PASTA domain-containing Ser/Thr kinase [Actinomycetaceae bacterium]
MEQPETIPTPVQGADPLLGTEVDGRYRVDEFLAAGGMASVYRAHDMRLGRDVALKVIHPHLALDPTLVTRFRAEASAAAQLHDPGIVAIHDQGEIDGRGYFVMELVEGRNLRSELTRCGSFTLGRAFDVLESLLRALAAAHRRGIIHRDIKPENVLLSDEGDVKVADFGLAHAVTAATGTTTGTVMGTVAYMAPEVVAQGASGAPSDIYSAGIILYELLVGQTPYADEPAIRVAWHHVNDELPRPTDAQRWIPTEVDELFALFTAKDPADRPANGEQALRELLRTRQAIPAPVMAQRSDVPGTDAQAHTQPMATRHKTSTLESATPPTPPAPPAKKRRRQIKWRRLIGVILILAGILCCAGAAWWYLVGPGHHIAIPDVSNKPVATAEKTLKDAGLTTKRDVEYSDTVKAGRVTRTNPKAGASVTKKQVVTLWVSQGVKTVTVPDGLPGKTRAEAEALLKKVPLTVGEVTEEYSDTVAKDQVIRISPDPGTVLPHDSRIDLVISKGREPVTVPTITGMSVDDAQKALTAAGLTGAASGEEFSDTVPEGQIISQDPKPGPGLFKGDKVTFVVSKGPEMVTVPNVRGKTMAEAEQMLKAQKLTSTRRSRLLGLDPDHVYDQTPAAGTKVKVGTTITLDYV